MDAGASAVLKSIKTLYQLFSGMKDGPPKVNDIRNVVGSLQCAFEQIGEFPELAEILATTPSLARLIKQCQDDINRFEGRLRKLDVSSGEQVLWKKLKLAVSEKDLAYMLTVVAGHVDNLTLEIDLVQA